MGQFSPPFLFRMGVPSLAAVVIVPTVIISLTLNTLSPVQLTAPPAPSTDLVYSYIAAIDLANPTLVVSPIALTYTTVTSIPLTLTTTHLALAYRAMEQIDLPPSPTIRVIHAALGGPMIQLTPTTIDPIALVSPPNPSMDLN